MPIRSKKIQWVTSPFNNSAWFGLYPCYGSCFVCVWLHHLVRTEFITVYNHDSNESLKIASALILRHITTRYTQTIPDIHNSLDQTLQICWARSKRELQMSEEIRKWQCYCSILWNSCSNIRRCLVGSKLSDLSASKKSMNLLIASKLHPCRAQT